jgi:hypothetical protein
MIFKTALLFGLLAGCYATPIAIKVPKSGARVLEKRIPGHISTSVDCGGMLISKEKIKAALEAGRTPRVVIGGYPADFFNLDGKNKVFNDATIIRLVSQYSMWNMDQTITYVYALTFNLPSIVKQKRAKSESILLD